MGLFIVGDVHGCWNTLMATLSQNWREDETLILVGDLIDRGKYSPETVEMAMVMKKQYGDRVIFLMGNHEQEFITHFDHGPNLNWLLLCGQETLKDYAQKGVDPLRHLAWFKTLPLQYESETVFVSHAGIAENIEDPYDLCDESSIIWNRGKKKNIGKMQVIGHTPHPEEPVYDRASNVWNIDTAAVYGGKLTGIRIDDEGQFIETVSIRVLSEDLV